MACQQLHKKWLLIYRGWFVVLYYRILKENQNHTESIYDMNQLKTNQYEWRLQTDGCDYG